MAVIRYSSYGQWSTKDSLSREDRELLMFHPKIVQLLLDGREFDITKEWLLSNFGKDFDFDNDSGTLMTLGFIEKYEVTSNYNLRPIILKIKKDGTVSKHHYFFSMFQDRLEKYEK